MKNNQLKIVTVVGARPQFIKAAVLRKKASFFGVNEILIHTGQHYDHQMSDVFFSELSIEPPNYKLNLTNRSHASMTGEMMAGIENILEIENPDWCVVYGDTNSTLAAALAAAKLHTPVCHIEAGLRSFNKRMPEEINRVLTDHVSELLFCPTSKAVENLKNENIKNGVYHVGDIMYDAAKLFGRACSRDEISKKHSLDKNLPIALITLHRAENVNSKQKLKDLIKKILEIGSGMQLVFPAHPNTQKRIENYGISTEGFRLIYPLSYIELQCLMSNASLVITDSGGVQKEAYFHGVRCVTMREETEWVETVENGWNRLYQEAEYVCDPKPIQEYGNGNCSDQILEILSNR